MLLTDPIFNLFAFTFKEMVVSKAGSPQRAQFLKYLVFKVNPYGR